MGSPCKTLLMHIAFILSIMLYLMSLLITPADSATLSIHRRQTVETYPSSTALYHIHNTDPFYVPINVRNKIYNLVFDTRSTLFWVRCPYQRMRGEDNNRPEFIERTDNRCPPESTNFRYVHHNHIKIWCEYDYKYGGGSRTEGYLVSMEFVAFVNAKIVFGCSRHTILGSNIDGVLGMSRGSYSFIKQMSDKYGWMFSLCIPSELGMSRGSYSFIKQMSDKYGWMFSLCIPSELGMSGYLKLGPESTIPSDPHVLKMLDDDRVHREWYNVPLVSMVVDSEEIVGPGTFDGGCVLDTGTGVSHLVKDAFDAIVALMDAALLRNGFTRNEEYSQVCYDYPTERREKIKVPIIELCFEGVSDTVVKMRWGSRQLFAWRNEAAFLELRQSPHTWSTIGAFQMTDIHYAFDLEENQIYFKESPSCGDD